MSKVPFEKERAEWRVFYKKVLGLSADLRAVPVPPRKRGFSRILFVAEGLTLNILYNAAVRRFRACRYTPDLDHDVSADDRTARTSYAVLVRDTAEADAELRNLSADDLTRKNIPCMTLTERLLYELKFFTEAEEHLDRRDMTMCAGSRTRLGRVPITLFGKGEFRVHWCSPADRYPRLRGREVVAVSSSRS